MEPLLGTTVHIVHGCPSITETPLNPPTRSYDKHWIRWTSARLAHLGFTVRAPLMPEPWSPDYAAFTNEFEKVPVQPFDVLIGHGCGGSFLVRWLGATKRRAAGLILVAPSKLARSDDLPRQALYDFQIDPMVGNRVGKVVIFTSDGQSDRGRRSARIFHRALRGQMINLPLHGHFTQTEMGTDAFPELVEQVTRL